MSWSCALNWLFIYDRMGHKNADFVGSSRYIMDKSWRPRTSVAKKTVRWSTGWSFGSGRNRDYLDYGFQDSPAFLNNLSKIPWIFFRIGSHLTMFTQKFTKHRDHLSHKSGWDHRAVWEMRKQICLDVSIIHPPKLQWSLLNHGF